MVRRRFLEAPATNSRAFRRDSAGRSNAKNCRKRPAFCHCFATPHRKVLGKTLVLLQTLCTMTEVAVENLIGALRPAYRRPVKNHSAALAHRFIALGVIVLIGAAKCIHQMTTAAAVRVTAGPVQPVEAFSGVHRHRLNYFSLAQRRAPVPLRSRSTQRLSAEPRAARGR